MRSTDTAVVLLALLVGASHAVAQADLRRPHPDSLPSVMLVPLDSLRWEPRQAAPGQSQIAIVHVDRETGATQLYFRLPPRFHAVRHWHTANETNVVVRGTFIIQHDGGERVTMQSGDFNFMPGRMIHQAWSGDDETIIFVSLDGRWDYHAATDSGPTSMRSRPDGSASGSAHADAVVLAGGSARTTQTHLPVIDMHLHAFAADAYGPPPARTCAGDLLYPAWDARKPLTVAAMAECKTMLLSPASDEENLRRTLEVMHRYNIVAVASGPLPVVRRWHAASPDHIIPAAGGMPPLDSVRAWAAAGSIRVLGELSFQYDGIAATDSVAETYFALAEQLDLPVGVHVGLSSPGVAFFGAPKYRARLSNPLLFEEALIRHPKLRLYIMHAGWPMLDEMVALMYTYPQVYVELGVVNWLVPRKEFHRYLRRLVEAGFGKRIMFGSDQNIWPETIPIAIEAVESAEFLTSEQKRDIFYNNAARFLRLPPS